jgi:hypothetical protein
MGLGSTFFTKSFSRLHYACLLSRHSFVFDLEQRRVLIYSFEIPVCTMILLANIDPDPQFEVARYLIRKIVSLAGKATLSHSDTYSFISLQTLLARTFW